MGNRFFSRLGWAFDRLLDFTALLACLLVIFLLLSVCYEVVMRYFFDAPTDWVVEYASLTVLWIPFLVSAYVLRLDRHTRMDILVSRFSPTTQAVINVISYIICAIICAGVAIYGTKVTWYYYTNSSVTETFLMLTKWPLMSIIPFSCILLFIEIIRKILKSLAEITGKTFSEEESRT
ncbi:TRAP transporter small permease subunit [Thermodesulfobacteriota bacterium]